MKFFYVFGLPLILLLITSGCTSQSFDTKNYEDSLYRLLVVPPPRGNTQNSSTNVVGQIIESATGMGAPIPPGPYVDYGSLLNFQEKHEEARDAWGKEIEWYPESKKFLTCLISKYYPDFPQDEDRTKQDRKSNTTHRQRRSILIWPPINQTDQPSAAGAFHATISAPLTEQVILCVPRTDHTSVFEQTWIA